MKILKKGVSDPKTAWRLEVECTANGNSSSVMCGALLELDENDVRFYNGNSGYFARDNQVTFRCPCCGGITDLKHDEWPESVYRLRPFTTKWRDTGEDGVDTEQYRAWIKQYDTGQ